MTKIFSIKYKFGICWYKNGTDTLHKETGPAKIYSNGSRFWYKNGLAHRTDGPAREFINGKKEYWLNGIKYPYIKTNEEWLIFQIIN